MTTKEAAAILSLKICQVQHLAFRGTLVGTQDEQGRWDLDLESIRAYAKNRTIGPPIRSTHPRGPYMRERKRLERERKKSAKQKETL